MVMVEKRVSATREEHAKDQDLELPSYAYYSKLPTAGRLVLPTNHQIPYTTPVPWNKRRELVQDPSDSTPQTRIAATNSSRSRCLNVDLDEDSGAFATYVPVTYQLPPTEEVVRRYINTPVMNEIGDKLDSVKDDITQSIRRIMKRGAPCHLCSIYDPHGTVTGAKMCEHFHDRATRTNYATYDPEGKCEHDMTRLMRRNKPIIPLPRSYVDSILDDDWEGGSNPIRQVHNEINKKASTMHVDSLTIRRDRPIAGSVGSRSAARGISARPLSRAATTAISEASGISNSGLGKPQPIVFGVEVPMLPSKPKVRVPNYAPDGYPATHLLTRRKGYRFVS